MLWGAAWLAIKLLLITGKATSLDGLQHVSSLSRKTYSGVDGTRVTCPLKNNESDPS